MLTATEIQFNRVAQGEIPEGEAVSWFEAQSAEGQVESLRVLARLCKQSHPLSEEVMPAIARSNLNAAFTPCVLLVKALWPESAFNKIVSLPADEHVKSFKLLIALFAVADSRRRETSCKDGCTYEWHNLPGL